MSVDPKLEAYLMQLDRSLAQISVSERAEIISEIKSHILETQENNSEKSLSSILESFGEPEIVANRFLTERGLKPLSAPKRTMVKWLTIGFLGTLGLGVFFTLGLLWFFYPFIEVDEKTDRVRLLGGAIDVSGSDFFDDLDINLDGVEIDIQSKKGQLVTNSKAVNVSKFKSFQYQFTNGVVRLQAKDQESIDWKCAIKGEVKEPLILEKGDQLIMNMREARKVACDLTVPSKLKLKVDGENGHIRIRKPTSETDVHLTNGKFEMDPDEGSEYKYDLSVANGSIDRDDFVSSDHKDAIQIRVKVTNGKIQH